MEARELLVKLKKYAAVKMSDDLWKILFEYLPSDEMDAFRELRLHLDWLTQELRDLETKWQQLAGE